MIKIFLPLVTTLLVGLKLTGYIAWSWWLVLLPLYGLPALGLILLTIVFTALLLRGYSVRGAIKYIKEA